MPHTFIRVCSPGCTTIIHPSLRSNNTMKALRSEHIHKSMLPNNLTSVKTWRNGVVLATLLLVLLCVGAPCQVDARHDSESFAAVKQELLAVGDPFGYYAGGTIHVSAAYPASTSSFVPIQLLFCSFADRDVLLNAHDTISGLCAANLTNVCEWGATLDSGHQVVEFSGVAKTTDLYEYLVLNCQQTTVEIEVAYKYVNPDGEHLSTTMIPFKTLSLVFSVAWGVVFAGWFFNYVKNRRISNPLFRCIGYIPFLTATQNVIALVYWRGLSRTGNQNVFLLLMMLALSGICTSFLLAILVLIAKGWHITRPRLLDSEWRNVAVMAIVFMVAYITWSVFEGFFFLFLLILVYVLVLRYLFASVSTNMRIILFQLRVMRQANPGAQENSLLPARQLRAIRVFRSALPVYIILDIMLHVWSMMALQRSPWAESMLLSGCTLVVVMFLCIVFRLQRYSVYYQDALFQPLMAATAIEPRDVVVICNPDSVDDSGNLIPNVAVGYPTAHDPCQPAGGGTYAPVEAPAGGGAIVAGNMIPAGNLV